MSNEQETENTTPIKHHVGETAMPRQSPATAALATQRTAEAALARQQRVESAPTSLPSEHPAPVEQRLLHASPEPQADGNALLLALSKPLTDLLNERRTKVNLTSNLKGWRRHLYPFTSWKDAGVMDADFQLENAYIDSLEKAARTVPGAEKDIQLLSMAAKNRAEELSDKSDFYPASVPLLTGLFIGTLAVTVSEPLAKWGFGLLTFLAIALFLSIRLNTRRQVAEMKIVANLLDLVEKRIR